MYWLWSLAIKEAVLAKSARAVCLLGTVWQYTWTKQVLDKHTNHTLYAGRCRY